MAPSLKPDLCNSLNIRDSPLALRNTASLLVIFSPENTLADFPAGSALLSPKAIFGIAGNLRAQSPMLSEGRRLPGALTDQEAHAGQAAPDSLLLNSQELWAVPYLDQNTAAVVSLHKTRIFCSRL